MFETKEPHSAPINLRNYEQIARGRLSKDAFDYYAGGAADEITLRRNEQDYADLQLRPRMLVDVHARDMATQLFDTRLAAPLLIAPMAFQAMGHPDGELASARAAASTGTAMILSTLSNYTIEEVADASNAPLWFQLYTYKDRGITVDLVARAQAAGYRAIVVTVDAPLLGRREADVRNRFQLPPHLCAKNLLPGGLQSLPSAIADSGLAAYFESLYDESLTWKDLEWLVSLTKLPVLVKGILRGDDAERAIACGAQGIIVSNHGGRQLDSAVSTIAALPEVVQHAQRQCKILVDGGIRRGTDILKAIALGADAVLIGRPILWGLAADGETGVASVLSLVIKEFDLAMALSGCPSLAAITTDLVATSSSRAR